MTVAIVVATVILVFAVVWAVWKIPPFPGEPLTLPWVTVWH